MAGGVLIFTVILGFMEMTDEAFIMGLVKSHMQLDYEQVSKFYINY
jgi:hypothetical protein